MDTSTELEKDSWNGEQARSRAGAWARAGQRIETFVAAFFGGVLIISGRVEW